MSVERVRELVEAATPGPWHVTNLGLVAGDRPFPSVGAFPYGRDKGAAVVVTTEPAFKGQRSASDAAFIAAARSLLPPLLNLYQAAPPVLDDALALLDQHTSPEVAHETRLRLIGAAQRLAGALAAVEEEVGKL